MRKRNETIRSAALKLVLFVIFFCNFIPVRPVRCQISPVTATGEALYLGFRQDFNNYIWQTRFIYRLPFRQKHRLLISENFSSNFLQTDTRSDKWKDDHRFRTEYSYLIRSWLRYMWLFESSIFSDRQTGFRNNFRTHFFGTGWVLTPNPTWNIKSYLGWKSDQRFERISKGWHFYLSTQSNPFSVANYINQFSMEWQGDQFRERRDRDFLLQYRVSKKFYQNTSDSLHIQIGRRKKMYYISVTGDLESRNERETLINNRLNYQITRNLIWKTVTTLYSRTSAVDQIIAQEAMGRRERRDFGLDLISGLRWRTRSFSVSLDWLYFGRDQKFLASESIRPTPFIGSIGVPDNASKTHSLRSAVNWTPSRKDSLTATFLLSRFQYDTPDTNNFDDRDEFRLTAGLNYTRRFSPALLVAWEANLNLHHLVYLFAERSANNNWNRIFQLSNLIRYAPTANFRLNQRAEVLANYTSYDFEALQFQIRSFVYRKFTLTDSVQIGRSGRVQISLYHRMELEENGRLFWQEFSEQLLLNRRNHYLTLGLQKPFGSRFFIYLGVAAYIRMEWRFRQVLTGKSVREKYGNFLSWGPQFKMFLMKWGQQVAQLSLAEYRVTTAVGSQYRVKQIDLNARWYF